MSEGEQSSAARSSDRRGPESIRELSQAALNDAIGTVDSALKDAREDVRRAVEIIWLVAGATRQKPWYGQTIPSLYNDERVPIGVALGNVADNMEYGARYLDDPAAQENVVRVLEKHARRLRDVIERGKRDYYHYLDELWGDCG